MHVQQPQFSDWPFFFKELNVSILPCLISCVDANLSLRMDTPPTAWQHHFQEGDQHTCGDIMTAHSWRGGADRGAASGFPPSWPAAGAGAASFNSTSKARSSLTCSLCGECFRVDYYGRKPPFCPQLVFMEDVFCMKDPFSVGGGGGEEGEHVSSNVGSAVRVLLLITILYFTPPFARHTSNGQIEAQFNRHSGKHGS